MDEAAFDRLRAGGFAGFRPACFAFLRGLADNQTRAWFEAHRAEYDADVRAPMTALVADLLAALAQRGMPFHGDPKRSVFRIHRDVRFAKDKRPYKTHASAALTRDGAKLSPGVLYVHIDPVGSFTAAGFQRPDADALRAMREAIVGKPGRYRDALDALGEAGVTLAPDTDPLTRLPRGFTEVEAPDLRDALCRRSFLMRRPLPQTALRNAGLVGVLADFAEAAMPLLRFGWTALDGRTR